MPHGVYRGMCFIIYNNTSGGMHQAVKHEMKSSNVNIHMKPTIYLHTIGFHSI